jgi:pyrroloquinoline quinone biosynthesis protein E
LIDLAVTLGARRVEVAHVQYYGWALKNRAALMPARAQVEAAMAVVAAARERLRGVLVIDAVVPDYFARFPKACVGGWGRQSLNVTPAGRVLPCHAAETIPGLRFDSVTERSLGDIWYGSEAFNRFRGTAWMPDRCRACERREIDWGGCRCQALALTGEAGETDPACQKSPHHPAMLALAAQDAAAQAPFLYRSFAVPSGG